MAAGREAVEAEVWLREGELQAILALATPEQWHRLDDTVYGLRAMLDDARSMRRRDVAILSDAFGFCRELLLRRPVEFGGPRECR